MKHACQNYEVKIWAYCLMPNHVHIVAVPSTETSLSKAIGNAHEAYTRYINFRQGWTGYLWQGRFFSFPMDNDYLWAATRYIELNPVKAGLVPQPENYPWSSAWSRINKSANPYLDIDNPLPNGADWRSFLHERADEVEISRIELHERSGRPLGSRHFIRALEERSGRTLAFRKRGRKSKANENKLDYVVCPLIS